ncbi:outer membrane efflux protein [mine drainage metagenome]|uniref:Outer membrane efflux protein n=1 Tax=mine drainage metagenome TaxID=410659 RepID=A0A1J5SAP5_9ZZZZ
MKRVIIIFLLAAQTYCYSQNNLTLSDAVNIALKNSPGIKIAKNNLNITNINNDYGVAGGLPSITVNGNDNQQSISLNQSISSGMDIVRNGVGSNTATLGLAATVPVYAGGKINAEKKRLEQVQQLSEQQLTSRGLTIASNVMLKYYDIIRQQSYAKTLEHSIEVSKQKLKIVETQREIGLSNNADLFQSQLDLNAQKQLLEAQYLVIDQAKTDLLTLLTLKADSAINLKDTIIIDKGIKLDSVLNNLYINPDIIAADKQIRINELLETETYALRYPAVNFNTGYNYNRSQSAAGNILFNQSLGPYVGLNFSLPVFNGNIYKKQYQVSSINTNNAKLVKDTLVIGYTSLAVKTFQSYTSNLRQLETQQKNYDLSLQLLDLVLQRFQLRQATIIDVKQAQQTFENAGYQLINLSYAAKAAEIQLRKLANKLVF